MCLKAPIQKTEQKTGIGYKIVRKTYEQGVYTNLWPYFNTEIGIGRYAPGRGEHIVFAHTTYKIGKLTRAKNKKVIISCKDRHKYNVGIYLFKDNPTYTHLVDEKETVIECKYFGAHHEDDSVVVADAIRPIRELNL